MTRFLKNTIRYLACLFLFKGSYIIAIDQAVQVVQFSQKYPRPWFTGPLLCPSGYVVPVGHINVQPYYYLNYTTGFYTTSWKSQSIDTIRSEIIQIPFKFGVVEKMDFGFVPQVIGQHIKNQSSWGIADCVATAGFQLLNAEIEDPWPAIKLGVRFVLPFGKYDKLNPKKLRTDIHGTGNYYPNMGLVFSKLQHLKGRHYIEFRLSTFYSFATNVTVKGRSLYNGKYIKKGGVKPGDLITSTFAIQYNFTKNWAFACDVFYKHQTKAKYFGPFDLQDPIVQENKITSDNFSISPAIEYNFTENYGLIAGSWLSIAGRNSMNFTSGVIAFNAYF